MVKPCDTFTKRGQDGRNNGTSPYSITPKLKPPMFHHRRVRYWIRDVRLLRDGIQLTGMSMTCDLG
jgi:hypothetical protein